MRGNSIPSPKFPKSFHPIIPYHQSHGADPAHEFAMADPENCNQEWAACLALVNEKKAAWVKGDFFWAYAYA
jgi:hypothetical protein